ncbi:MrcB family domain-containing protein [Methylobacterium sp. CM6241]
MIEEVIALQRVYSDQNTKEMERRGQLVRDVLPTELRRVAATLRPALGPFGEDATAEGRDGTGRKTHIPWVRWYSPSRSPSAQSGWYVVYLFHPEGAGVSLCLSHGSTSLQNGSYVSRSDEEAAELMTWAASVVGAEFRDDKKIRRGIELGSRELARAYERTTVFSKLYPAGSIPPDRDLLQDIIRFCEPLRKLYRAQELGLVPGETHVDVAALNQEIDKFTAPLRSRTGGQGRGLPAPLRKLVEMHAMGRAKEWLKAQGFTYKDVSASDSCDFRALRSGDEWVVEVKGTTGGPSSILITRNEVALHRQAYPKNVLLVVHGIELDATTPKVSGGDLLAMVPWRVDEERLNPICFEYRLG